MRKFVCAFSVCVASLCIVSTSAAALAHNSAAQPTGSTTSPRSASGADPVHADFDTAASDLTARSQWLDIVALPADAEDGLYDATANIWTPGFTLSWTQISKFEPIIARSPSAAPAPFLPSVEPTADVSIVTRRNEESEGATCDTGDPLDPTTGLPLQRCSLTAAGPDTTFTTQCSTNGATSLHMPVATALDRLATRMTSGHSSMIYWSTVALATKGPP